MLLSTSYSATNDYPIEKKKSDLEASSKNNLLKLSLSALSILDLEGNQVIFLLFLNVYDILLGPHSSSLHIGIKVPFLSASKQLLFISINIIKTIASEGRMEGRKRKRINLQFILLIRY